MQEVENKQRKAERKREYEEWLITKPDPIPRIERIDSGRDLIHIFLRRFKALTAEERVRVLAEEKWFSLDVIPRELIPLNAESSSLTEANRKALILRIDKFLNELDVGPPNILHQMRPSGK